jgi:hypothetical protein
MDFADMASEARHDPGVNAVASITFECFTG